MDRWWLTIAGAAPGELFVALCFQAVAERGWICTNPPGGARKGLGVSADRSSHLFDRSPASSRGGTDGVGGEEGGSAAHRCERSGQLGWKTLEQATLPRTAYWRRP